MKIVSQAFGHNEIMPAKFTCDGENVNPPLSISEVPEGTASLVLVVDDPDAPGGTFTHWIVYNLDPTVSEIAENNLKDEEFRGKNSFGTFDYGGPCPPRGMHHYRFKLYALDTMLTLYKPDLDELTNAMDAHILDQAELVALYKRAS